MTPPPRELTAELDSLSQFLTEAWVADNALAIEAALANASGYERLSAEQRRQIIIIEPRTLEPFGR